MGNHPKKGEKSTTYIDIARLISRVDALESQGRVLTANMNAIKVSLEEITNLINKAIAMADAEEEEVAVGQQQKK